MKEFPIGTTSSYTPCEITNTGAGGAKDFDVRVFSGVYEHGISGALVESPIANYCNRTWEITPEDEINLDATVKLYWNSSDEGSSFDNTNVKMIKNEGGASDIWTPISASYAGSTAEGGSVFSKSESSITNFSKFSIGDDAVVLPIELVAFIGFRTREQTTLKWSTATEVNNALFELERSYDGIHFESIGSIMGAGNSVKLTTINILTPLLRVLLPITD